MKIKTEFIGLKIEPVLKKEAARDARIRKLHLSEWIRVAMIEKLQAAKANAQR